MKATWENTDKGVTVVRLKWDGNMKSTWHCLLSSDRHHDNPYCDQELEKQHLDKALELNAGIIDAGDLHCAMQGKYDKRSSKSAIREEHMEGNYLDRLVETAADFYEPYAKNWIVMGAGNHEESIRQHHETDLNQRLIGVLNDRTKSNIQFGYTQGYVKFIVYKPNGRTIETKKLFYLHGHGGGGIMSFDTLQCRRLLSKHRADAYIFGHTHQPWCIPFTQDDITPRGTWIERPVTVCKLPSYKSPPRMRGWEANKGFSTMPVGCAWLKIQVVKRKNKKKEFQEYVDLSINLDTSPPRHRTEYVD